MRKSVIFFIGIIFIISIVVVSFFGMQARLDQFKTYITEINITTYNQVVGGKKYYVVDYTEGLSIPIEYSVTPNEANLLTNVEYFISNNTYVDEHGETKPFALIDTRNGVLDIYTYLENNHLVNITVRATDGSNKSDSLIVLLRNPS